MDIRIENLSYFCFRKIRWSLRMIMGMKKLLSLPPNLVDCFHAVEHVSTEEWFCTSDPVGARLGSGGGTTWLLEASRQKEARMYRRKSGWDRRSVSCCMPEGKAAVCPDMRRPGKY